MKTLHAAVLGAGALGSFLGSRLAEAGHEVVLVGRREHADAINRQGLTILHGGDKKTVRVQAAQSAGELKGRRLDLVLLTVKAHQTRAACEELKTALRGDTPVLAVQNGIGVEDEAADVLGSGRYFRGVAFCGVTLEGPGVIRLAGFSHIELGSLAREGSERAGWIAEVLSGAGLKSRVARDLRSAVWLKGLINAGINPIATLARKRNGELLSSPPLKELMIRTVGEGARVAARVGVALEEDPVEATLRTARATAENKNSMLQDIERGRKTEIDYLNGAIVRHGEEASVETPINEALTALMRGLEATSALSGLGGEAHAL